MRLHVGVVVDLIQRRRRAQGEAIAGRVVDANQVRDVLHIDEEVDVPSPFAGEDDYVRASGEDLRDLAPVTEHLHGFVH